MSETRSVSMRTDAEIEQELETLREDSRKKSNEIESLQAERQEWIHFAEIDKKKIRALETRIQADQNLLEIYMKGK